MRPKGDFTADRRLILISAIGLFIGALCAIVAVVLLKLIGSFTNPFFFGRLSLAFINPAENHPGIAVMFVPVVGGPLIGFMARYGSDRIRGQSIPEAMEATLIGRSRMQPKVAMLGGTMRSPLTGILAFHRGTRAVVLRVAERPHPPGLSGAGLQLPSHPPKAPTFCIALLRVVP